MAREPNTLLADAMRRAGFSNSGLAAHVRSAAHEQGSELRCTHVDVRRWLDGVVPRPATAGFIAAALSRKGGFLVSLADIGMGGTGGGSVPEGRLEYPADGAAAGQQVRDLTRRDLAEETDDPRAGIVTDGWAEPMLAWLLSRPESLPARDGVLISVGESDVAAVRTAVRMFMRMDFQFGGGYARTALAQFFAHDVHPLLEGKFSDKVGRELFSAAAEVAQLLGWTAYDDGRHGLAQRYLVQGLRLAQAADDRMMGSWILSSMSHQATYLGHFGQGVQLARAAQEGSRGAATATVMAVFLAMEARAHAGAGDGAACAQALLDAERFFEGAATGDDPEWVSYFDAAELAGEGSHCFRDLHSPRTAQQFIAQAEELTDPSYVRTLAFIRLVHAATVLQQREPGHAVELATQAIDLAGSLKSMRYLRYIRDLCADLDEYAGDADVRTFWELVARKYPSLGGP
jgi:hypothetical protein